MLSSNPYVGISPGIKISLFLSSICTNELISAPKLITYFPKLPSVTKNSENESNPKAQPLYLYLYRSALLVSFTDLNKQLFNIKSLFKFITCGFSF